MYPPIFELCEVDADVITNLGDPVRLFIFGDAKGTTLKPYAVWQTIGGAPENILNGTPDIDEFTIQVDVYSDSKESTRNVAKALRNVIEQHAHIVFWGGEGRDPVTRNHRYTFRADWFVERDDVS